MSDSDPLAHWPERTPLLDADGATVLVYSAGDTERDGRPWVDGAWRPPDVDAEHCADVVLSELAGAALSTNDADLVDALRRRGAHELRHAHSMTLDLTGEPIVAQVPDGVSVTSLTADEVAELAADVGAVARRAHADDGEGWPSDAEAARAMRRTAAGEVLGPLLDSSVLARRADRVVGACLIVDRAGDPPYGGPWVLDVFRDPADPARGIGAAMLAHAARSLRSAGLGALSLVVTHDNAGARAVYERLGFDDLGESWTLAIPEPAEETGLIAARRTQA